MATPLTEVMEARGHRYNESRSNKLVDTAAGKYTYDTLPNWLMPYVQNPSWAKRYAALLNEGHGWVLRRVIEEIERRGVGKRCNYMNKACSHDQWDTTLKGWQKTARREEHARRVFERLATALPAKRLEALKQRMGPIYAACERWGEAAIRHAVTAVETAKQDVFKYFCWLTSPRRLEEARHDAEAWKAACVRQLGQTMPKIATTP